MSKPVVLKAAELPDSTVAEMEKLFTVLHLPKEKAEIPAFLRDYGSTVQGMALRKTIVDAALLDALPKLDVIASYSAGLDNVDVAAVRARGIALHNSSHILARDVANTAILLLLAVTRDLVNADAFVRDGRWSDGGSYPLGRSIVGVNVGILGLGAIGTEIARRLEVLGARVAYSGRNQKPVDWPYFPTPLALAQGCDVLILTCPLTDETRHSVDAAVLDALGPRGYLVNIARGPVVDEAALIAALANRRVAGAGLDVFEFEPQIPRELLESPRLVLTPHIGSGTEETRQAMADNVVDCLATHFDLGEVERA